MAEVTLMIDATRQTAADGREWLIMRLPHLAARTEVELMSWSERLIPFVGGAPFLLLGMDEAGRLMTAGHTEHMPPTLRLQELEWFRSPMTLRDPAPESQTDDGGLLPEDRQ